MKMILIKWTLAILLCLPYGATKTSSKVDDKDSEPFEKKAVYLTKDNSNFEVLTESTKKNEIILLDFPGTTSRAPYWKKFIPSFNDYITFLKREYLSFLKSKVIFGEKTKSSKKSKNSQKSGGENDHQKQDGASGQGGQKNDTESPKTTANESSSTYSTPPTRGYIYTGSADRFNYASVDCAAGIMATNKGARSASAILHKDKDRYLLDKCTSERFFVVELCQEIEVQTLLMSNFEFFSSTFRHFNVYTSSRYPPKEPDGWYLAGSFEALDTRNTQAFDVHLPQVWIKYLKIEFLSHYGDEYYCPISQIKVFGPTMLVEYLDSQERESNVVDRLTTGPSPVSPFPAAEEQNLLEKLASKPIKHETPKLDLPRPLKKPKVPEVRPISLRKIPQICFPPNVDFALPKCMVAPQTRFGFRERLLEIFLPKCPLDSQPDSASPSETDGFCSGQISCTETLSQEELPLFASQTSSLPGPGTGSENVFRTMARRLDGLENKYSLLEGYINEQTIALNSILAKMDAQQERQLRAALNDISRTSKQQMEQLKRSHEEVWSVLFHRIEASNAKLHSEVVSLNQKVNLLAEEVMFGKRMALAQLTILFIVVAMVILVQLYYSAFNSKAYPQNPDFGTSMPPSPGAPLLLPPSIQPSPIQDPGSNLISPIQTPNLGFTDPPDDSPYHQELDSSRPPLPLISKSMDDILLNYTPILLLVSDTPPCSSNLPVTPPDSSISQPSSSLDKG